MLSPIFKEQIENELDKLPVELQRKVLNFAHALSVSSSQGAAGTDLMKFSGVLSSADAEEMKQAIEEGCEQVNPDEW